MKIAITHNDSLFQGGLLPYTGIRPATGTLVSLKARDENNVLPDTSFTQYQVWDYASYRLGTAGVVNMMRLSSVEIAFLETINKDPFGNYLPEVTKDWNWACGHVNGDYYQLIETSGGETVPNTIACNFNWVAPTSFNINDRNVVCVDGYRDGFYSIVGAPRMASYESLKDFHWLKYKIGGNYRVGSAANNWNPGPFLRYGFLFDPMSFPHGASKGGFWMEERWVHEVLGETVIPWRL